MLTLWHTEKLKPMALENWQRKSVMFCFVLLSLMIDTGFKIFIKLYSMNIVTALIKILIWGEEKFPKMPVHNGISYLFSRLSEVGAICFGGSIIQGSQMNVTLLASSPISYWVVKIM